MIIEISGWITAIILLTAGLVQLSKILKTGNATGVSSLAWFLYGIAGIGSYIFAEKYFALQAVLAFLLSGTISLTVGATAYIYNRKRKR